MRDHEMLAPDATDLRWRCDVCDWTASDVFSSPEMRGASWERRHGEHAASTVTAVDVAKVKEMYR